MSNDIAKTLKERGSRYGKFIDHARVTQDLKAIVSTSPSEAALTPSMREALDMIMHKVGRILCGDPAYADSWHDIAGYATLIEKELEGKNV